MKSLKFSLLMQIWYLFSLFWQMVPASSGVLFYTIYTFISFFYFEKLVLFECKTGGWDVFYLTCLIISLCRCLINLIVQLPWVICLTFFSLYFFNFFKCVCYYNGLQGYRFTNCTVFRYASSIFEPTTVIQICLGVLRLEVFDTSCWLSTGCALKVFLFSPFFSYFWNIYCCIVFLFGLGKSSGSAHFRNGLKL